MPFCKKWGPCLGTFTNKRNNAYSECSHVRFEFDMIWKAWVINSWKMGFGNEQAFNDTDMLPGTTLINYYNWSMQRCFQQLFMQCGWKNSFRKKLLVGKLAMHGCDVKFIHNKLFLSINNLAINWSISNKPFCELTTSMWITKGSLQRKWTRNGFLQLFNTWGEVAELCGFSFILEKVGTAPNTMVAFQRQVTSQVWLTEVRQNLFMSNARHKC